MLGADGFDLELGCLRCVAGERRMSKIIVRKIKLELRVGANANSGDIVQTKEFTDSKSNAAHSTEESFKREVASTIHRRGLILRLQS